MAAPAPSIGGFLETPPSSPTSPKPVTQRKPTPPRAAAVREAFDMLRAQTREPSTHPRLAGRGSSYAEGERSVFVSATSSGCDAEPSPRARASSVDDELGRLVTFIEGPLMELVYNLNDFQRAEIRAGLVQKTRDILMLIAPAGSAVSRAPELSALLESLYPLLDKETYAQEELEQIVGLHEQLTKQAAGLKLLEIRYHLSTCVRIVENIRDDASSAAALVQMLHEPTNRALNSVHAFMAFKGDGLLARTMVHDLSAPLNGTLRLLEGGDAPYVVGAVTDPEVYPRLLGIVSGNDLIEEIVEFSPKELCEKVILSQLGNIQDNKLTVTLDAAENLPRTFRGDKNKALRCAINLLSNAIKFASKETVRNKEIILQARRTASNGVSFHVIDHAGGMSQETWAKLVSQKIESFTSGRVEESGMESFGLGISSVKRLLSIMNSKLEGESVLGQGTRIGFCLSLPLRTPGRTPAGLFSGRSPSLAATTSPGGASTSCAAVGSERSPSVASVQEVVPPLRDPTVGVIFADDAPTVTALARAALNMALSSPGAPRTKGAPLPENLRILKDKLPGQPAYDAFVAAINANQRVDIVFLDQNMRDPNGRLGTDFAIMMREYARSHGKQMPPVIILSGDPDPDGELRKLVEGLGFRLEIKPFTNPRIIALINQVCS